MKLQIQVIGLALTGGLLLNACGAQKRTPPQIKKDPPKAEVSGATRKNTPSATPQMPARREAPKPATVGPVGTASVRASAATELQYIKTIKSDSALILQIFDKAPAGTSGPRSTESANGPLTVEISAEKGVLSGKSTDDNSKIKTNGTSAEFNCADSADKANKTVLDCDVLKLSINVLTGTTKDAASAAGAPAAGASASAATKEFRIIEIERTLDRRDLKVTQKDVKRVDGSNINDAAINAFQYKGRVALLEKFTVQFKKPDGTIEPGAAYATMSNIIIESTAQEGAQEKIISLSKAGSVTFVVEASGLPKDFDSRPIYYGIVGVTPTSGDFNISYTVSLDAEGKSKLFEFKLNLAADTTAPPAAAPPTPPLAPPAVAPPASPASGSALSPAAAAQGATDRQSAAQRNDAKCEGNNEKACAGIVFYSEGNTFKVGDQVRLVWNAPGAMTVTIDGKAVDSFDSRLFPQLSAVGKKSFKLVATYPSPNTPKQMNLIVDVIQPAATAGSGGVAATPAAPAVASSLPAAAAASAASPATQSQVQTVARNNAKCTSGDCQGMEFYTIGNTFKVSDKIPLVWNAPGAISVYIEDSKMSSNKGSTKAGEFKKAGDYEYKLVANYDGSISKRTMVLQVKAVDDVKTSSGSTVEATFALLRHLN